MSSRSFRRRNNRRRHRPGGEGQAQEQGQPQQGGAGQQPRQGGAGQQARQQRPSNHPGRRGAPPREGRQRAPEPPRIPWPVLPAVLPDCPICGKPVKDLASALTHRLDARPAHFDCVMQEIRDTNEIAPQEKVCYLGGGTFGIIELRPPGGPTRFVIRKRIQYEEKEKPQDWKKQLQVPC
jgi:hypothetical protein